MTLYKLAKIVHIGNGYAIVEKNQEGFMLQIPDTRRLKIDEFRKFYIYKHITEFRRNSYGFLSFKEWIFFQDLLKLAGVGPKIAFQLLDQGFEYILEKIVSGNTESLSEIPYVSEKTAKQIIFQLSEKYQRFSFNTGNDSMEVALKENANFQRNLKNNLKNLGFQPHMIKVALEKNLEVTDLDAAIQNCIQIISHESNNTGAVTNH